MRKYIKFILTKFNVPPAAIHIDTALFREPNSILVYGDTAETQSILGWTCTRSIYETIDRMIEFQKTYNQRTI